MNNEEKTLIPCPLNTCFKSYLPAGLPEKDSQVASVIRTLTFELAEWSTLPLGSQLAGVLDT